MSENDDDGHDGDYDDDGDDGNLEIVMISNINS